MFPYGCDCSFRVKGLGSYGSTAGAFPINSAVWPRCCIDCPRWDVLLHPAPSSPPLSTSHPQHCGQGAAVMFSSSRHGTLITLITCIPPHTPSPPPTPSNVAKVLREVLDVPASELGCETLYMVRMDPYGPVGTPVGTLWGRGDVVDGHDDEEEGASLGS